MFFYLIHNLPIWESLPAGKRNTRTFFVGLLCYIMTHAFLYSDNAESYPTLKLFREYFFYFLLADAFTMGVLYKLRYGRSILYESAPDENKHQWDPATERYYDRNRPPGMSTPRDSNRAVVHDKREQKLDASRDKERRQKSRPEDSLESYPQDQFREDADDLFFEEFDEHLKNAPELQQSSHTHREPLDHLKRKKQTEGADIPQVEKSPKNKSPKNKKKLQSVERKTHNDTERLALNSERFSDTKLKEKKNIAAKQGIIPDSDYFPEYDDIEETVPNPKKGKHNKSPSIITEVDSAR